MKATCPKCIADLECDLLEYVSGKQIVTQTTYPPHQPCGRHVVHTYRDKPGAEPDPAVTNATLERICPKCSTAFQVDSKFSPKKFCSPGCVKGRKDPHKREVKRCAWCDSQFEPRNSRIRFCSKSCAGRSQHDRIKVVTEPEEAPELGACLANFCQDLESEPGRNYCANHGEQPLDPDAAKLCPCGCGRQVNPSRKFHHPSCAGRGKARSEEVKAKQRASIRAKQQAKQAKIWPAAVAANSVAVAANAELDQLRQAERAQDQEISRLLGQVEDLQEKLVAAEQANAKLNSEAERLAELACRAESEIAARLSRPHRLAGWLAEAVPAKLLFAAAGLAKCLEEKGE